MQRFYAKPSMYPGGHPTFTVMVKVGTREFVGEGATAQLARHAAAAKALSEIRQLPLPEEKMMISSDNGMKYLSYHSSCCHYSLFSLK